ncbi:MAG TPA: aminotransferase class I/II-fold pyridoxal phosphate-dependent enzyme, partial [Leptospiraceae bacterium]|nr:aminotransferase class I/II-fold pyridoxal phosphate-dependent enzyme [Leptospiraceae bacterium]
AGYPPITYRLDPARGWMPDLEELRNKVKYNESIAGIMIINPDNPTGAVFPRDVLEEMVEIARQYDLFLVGDEIYVNMVFNGKKCTNLSEVIREVPGISLKGISKEFPWPGGRCGWMEVYNQASNPMFQKYVKSVLDAKMLEVCSTTLPQVVIPRIMGNPEYVNWQKQRNAFFEKRSKRIAEILSGIPEIIVNPPDGAFYVSIVFKIELNNRMKLNIPNAAVREYIDGICSGNMEPDRRFVYHLLASRNICVVPLTSFVCTLQGFRCTLLERDDAKFEEIYHGVRDAILEFLNSASL